MDSKKVGRNGDFKKTKKIYILCKKMLLGKKTEYIKF